MMGLRTPRMPAAPRVGRSGRVLGFGLRRIRRRVERAHNAVYAWICKPILAAGQAPGHRLNQLAPMASPVQHQGARAIGGPAPRRSTCLWSGSRKSGRQLSERSCATASAVAGSLSEDVLALAPAERHSGRRNTPIGGGTRLPPVTAEPANRRFERPQARRCRPKTWARLAEVNCRPRPAGPALIQQL